MNLRTPLTILIITELATIPLLPLLLKGLMTYEQYIFIHIITLIVAIFLISYIIVGKSIENTFK